MTQGKGGGGSPARAGIDPLRNAGQDGCRRFPRTRGDRPQIYCATLCRIAVPPHARGIDRRDYDSGQGWRRFPRTRGDRPAWITCSAGISVVPPHARG